MCLMPLPDLECPVPLLASAIGPRHSAKPCILKAAMQESSSSRRRARRRFLAVRNG